MNQTMIIGHFHEENGHFTGIIQTLCFSTDAVFVPVERAEAGSPDYRVSTGDTDLGMAWREAPPVGEPFLLVQLDDPLFPRPVYCRLVHTGAHGHTLIWDRVERN
jgi:uncharacterized protein (DUF736 family)